MAIPTMAIGCSMTQASAGPGLVESLKDVSNAIEALTITPPQNPTHLGLGVRFDSFIAYWWNDGRTWCNARCGLSY